MKNKFELKDILLIIGLGLVFYNEPSQIKEFIKSLILVLGVAFLVRFLVKRNKEKALRFSNWFEKIEIKISNIVLDIFERFLNVCLKIKKRNKKD